MTADAILIKETEIEKSIINQLLAENKEEESIKFISEKANVDLTAAKYVVELFKTGKINNYDNRIADKKTKEKKHADTTTIPGTTQPVKRKTKKYLIITGLVLLSVFLFLKYYIGFNHVKCHLQTLKTDIFGNDEPEDTTLITVAESPVILGPDTTVVMNVQEDLYPYDTSIISPEAKAEEIEKIKNAHFENLTVAKNPLTHEDAQIALTHFTNSKLTDVIMKQGLVIKIGHVQDQCLATFQIEPLPHLLVYKP